MIRPLSNAPVQIRFEDRARGALLALAITVALFGGSDHFAVLVHQKAYARRAAERQARIEQLAREDVQAREIVRRFFEAAARAAEREASAAR